MGVDPMLESVSICAAPPSAPQSAHKKRKNFFVKPNEQSSSLLEYSAMARKSLLKTNVFMVFDEMI